MSAGGGKCLKKPKFNKDGSQIRGADGKFINVLGDEFDPTLIKKGELLLVNGKWKIKTNGEYRSAKGSYNYIVNNGNVYVGLQKSQGQGHIDIARGKPVDYAGQIKFGSSKKNKGTLQNWDNASGHYKPEPINPSFADTIPLPSDKFQSVNHNVN